MSSNRHMYRLLLITIVTLFIAKSDIYSQDSLHFSLLTIAPGDNPEDAFGHTGLRLVEESEGVDVVFNYGIYNFDAPNFLLNFMRGKLNYMLGAYSTKAFMNAYYMQKRSIREQPLDLSSEQAVGLRDFLSENVKPENKYYLYDFFFDNCATRTRDLFENHLDGFGYLDTINPPKTYRDLVDEYVETRPWLDFGIDLIIGAKADKQAHFRDQMFLPDYLHDYLYEAYYQNGIVDTLIVTKSELIMDFEHIDRKSHSILTPVVVFNILFFILIALLYWKRETSLFNYVERTWWVCLAIVSVIMIVMWFGTDHQLCGNNWNLLWANPLILSFFILRRLSNNVHKGILGALILCNFIALISVFTGFPQAFHDAIRSVVFINLIFLIDRYKKI